MVIKLPKAVAVALLSWLLLSSQISSQSSGDIPAHIRVLLPSTDEPVPVALWASGCSGFFHPRAPWHFLERAQYLLASGYAVAYVDYIAAAGHETACAGELTLPEIGRILVDAVRIVQRDARFDPQRVVLIGGSLGGGGILAALSSPEVASLSPVGALVLYPACDGVRSWSVSVPVWIWSAGDDQITPPAGCRTVLDQVAGPIVEHTYPGVHHAFDMRGLPTGLEPGEAAISYDPGAGEDVWTRIGAVLAELGQSN